MSDLSSNIAWLAFIGHRRLWAGDAGTVPKHFVTQDLLCIHQGKSKVAMLVVTWSGGIRAFLISYWRKEVKATL